MKKTKLSGVYDAANVLNFYDFKRITKSKTSGYTAKLIMQVRQTAFKTVTSVKEFTAPTLAELNKKIAAFKIIGYSLSSVKNNAKNYYIY